MIGGFVLDATAVLDAATGRTLYTRALVRSAVQVGMVLTVPAAALAEVWATIDPGSRSFLRLFVDRVVVVVEPLRDADVEAVGLLAGSAGGDAGVPLGIAQAVRTARVRGWPVVTAVPAQVRSLDPGVQVNELP